MIVYQTFKKRSRIRCHNSTDMSAYNLSTLLPAEMCLEIQGWVDAMEEHDRLRAQFQRAMKSVRLLGVARDANEEWEEDDEPVVDKDNFIFTCVGRGVWVGMIGRCRRGGHRKNYELFKTGRLDEREEEFGGVSFGYGDFWDDDDECYFPPLCEFFDWERQ